MLLFLWNSILLSLPCMRACIHVSVCVLQKSETKRKETEWVNWYILTYVSGLPIVSHATHIYYRNGIYGRPTEWKLSHISNGIACSSMSLVISPRVFILSPFLFLKEKKIVPMSRHMCVRACIYVPFFFLFWKTNSNLKAFNQVANEIQNKKDEIQVLWFRCDQVIESTAEEKKKTSEGSRHFIFVWFIFDHPNTAMHL